MAAGPVEQVAVDALYTEPLQSALAGCDRPAPRGVGRQHLADEERLLSPPADRFADQLLHAAVAIHLGGVDVVHAEVETAAKRGDGARAVVALHVPGALADDGDFAAGGAEGCRANDAHS